MTDDEQMSEVNEITDLLIRLRPSRADLDSRVVFYEAGYNACLSRQDSAGRRPKLLALVAGGLLAAVATASASYHLGGIHATRSFAATGEHNQSGALDKNETPEPKRVAAATPPKTPAVVPTKTDIATTTKIAPHEPADSSYGIARWSDPLQDYARSAQLDREANTTLTAFHSALVSARHVDRDWGDFPFPDSLGSYRDSFTLSPNAVAVPASPLAVGDLQHITQHLEATR